MKIENTLKGGVAPSRVRESKSAPAKGGGRQVGRTSISDDVRLTATSGMMRVLEAELTGVEVTDSGKIESIRQAIADGSFVVDEQAVADGLIQESIDHIAHRPEKCPPSNRASPPSPGNWKLSWLCWRKKPWPWPPAMPTCWRD